MGEVAELKQVEVSSLQPHPDNPRLVIRQDVVDGIAANLNGVFPEKHAIHVRPIEGGYQVLSGHHRLAAAKARDSFLWHFRRSPQPRPAIYVMQPWRGGDA